MNVINVMWSGGAPYMSVHTVHQQMLRHLGDDVEIANWLLLGNGLCNGAGSVREWHMPTRALKGRRLWSLLMPLLRARLRVALEQERPDAILIDGLGVARLILPLMRHLPETRVTVLFHGTTRLRGKDVRLLRGLAPGQLCLAAVSQTLARSMEQVLGRSVQTLRIALDPSAFALDLLDRGQARRALALPDRPGRVFGAVGRLVPSKGFEMLVKAFAQARQSQPDIRLVIMGDGEMKAQLQSRCDELGLGDSLLLCGYRSDVSRLYRAFDWLLIPSRSEGLGLVLQEGVMADVPVLCSDLSVFREQLGEAGCYIPVGDQTAWTRAIVACNGLDASATAAVQRRALAPEQAWLAFRHSSKALLQG